MCSRCIRFTAEIADDPVLGFTELVRRNPLTKEQLESLAIIEQRGRELLVLIDTILDSARVEGRVARGEGRRDAASVF